MFQSVQIIHAINSGQLNDIHSAFNNQAGYRQLSLMFQNCRHCYVVQLKQSQLFYFSLPYQASEWLAIGCWEAFDEGGVRRFWEQLANQATIGGRRCI